MTNGIVENYGASRSEMLLAEKVLSSGAVGLTTSRVEMRRGRNAKSVKEKERRVGLFKLDRLFNPQNAALSLESISRVAGLSGKRLVLEIRDMHPVKIIETGKG